MYLIQTATYSKKEYRTVMDHQENIRRKSSSLPGYTRGFHDAFLNYSPSASRWEGVKVAAKPGPSPTGGAVIAGRNPENMDANGSLTAKEKKKKWSGWGAFFRRTKTTSKKSSGSEHSSDSEPEIPLPKPRHSRQGHKEDLNSKPGKLSVAHPVLIRDTVQNTSVTRANAAPPAAKTPDVVPSNLSTSGRFPLHGHERRDLFTNKGLVNRNGESLSSDDDSRASLLNRSQDSLASSSTSRRSRGARTERYLQRKSRDADYMQREARMHKSASPQCTYDQMKPSYSPNQSQLQRAPASVRASSACPDSTLGIPYPFVDSSKPAKLTSPSTKSNHLAPKSSAPPTPPPRNPLSKSYLLKVTPAVSNNRPTSYSFGQLRHDYQNVHKDEQLASNLSPKLGSRPYSAVNFSQIPVRKTSPAVAEAPNFQHHWVAASPSPSHNSSTSSIPPLIPARSRLSSASFSPPLAVHKKSPSPFGVQSDIAKGNITRKTPEPPAVPPKMFKQQPLTPGCKRTGSLSSQSSELSTPSSKVSSEDSSKGAVFVAKPLQLPGIRALSFKTDSFKGHQHVRELSKLKPSNDKNLEQAICELEEIYDSLRLSDEDLLDRAERRDLPTPHQELGRGAASSSSCCSESDKGEQLAGVTSDLDTMMNWSISGSFESLVYPAQPRLRAPMVRRSAIPDKVGDDMAVRRLSSKPDVKPQSVLAKSGSYLLVSAAINGTDPLPARQSDSSDPDIVLDDVAFRNVRQANSLKIIDPQPPFGIPLGPVTPAPLSDYLHADAKEKRRSLFRPMRFPDLVKDDLAYRNLRKDGGHGPSLGPPGSHVNTEKLDDILREAGSKHMPSLSLRKKRAVRSMSANITHLVRQESMKPCGGEESENFFNDTFPDIESVVQDLIIPQRTIKAAAKIPKHRGESPQLPGLAALYPKSALLEKRKSASPKKDLDETFDNMISDLTLDSSSQNKSERNRPSVKEDITDKPEPTTWNNSPLFTKQHNTITSLPEASDHGETSGESHEVREILKHVIPGEDEQSQLECVSSSCMSRVVATANSLHETLTADDDYESRCMSRDSAFVTDAGSSDDGTCSSLNVSSEFSCKLTDFMFCDSPAVSSSPTVDNSHEDVATPHNSSFHQVPFACNYTLARDSSNADEAERHVALNVHSSQLQSQPSSSLKSGAPNSENSCNLREPPVANHHKSHCRKSKHRSLHVLSEEESSTDDEEEKLHSSYSQYRQQRKHTKLLPRRETSNSDDTASSEQLLRVDCSPNAPFRRFIRRNSPSVSSVNLADNEAARKNGKATGANTQQPIKESQKILLRAGKTGRPNKDKSTKRKSNLNRSFNEEQITPTSEEDGGKRSRARRAYEAAVSYSSAETDQQSTSETHLTKTNPTILDQIQSPLATTKVVPAKLETKPEDKQAAAAAGIPWRQTGKLSRVSDITARIEALNSLAKQTAARVDKLTSRTTMEITEPSKDKSSSGSEFSTKDHDSSRNGQDTRGPPKEAEDGEAKSVELENTRDDSWDIPWRKKRLQQQKDLQESQDLNLEVTPQDEKLRDQVEPDIVAVEVALSGETVHDLELPCAEGLKKDNPCLSGQVESQYDAELQKETTEQEPTSSACLDKDENTAESTVAPPAEPAIQSTAASTEQTTAANLPRNLKGMVRSQSLGHIEGTNTATSTMAANDTSRLRDTRSLSSLHDKDGTTCHFIKMKREVSTEVVDDEPGPPVEDLETGTALSVLTVAKHETPPLSE